MRNPCVKARAFTHELQTGAGVNVSDQTIRNNLRSRNLRCPAVRIPLTRRHRRLLLDWYRRNHHWTARQWSTVCFSDKSRFDLRFNDGRILVYRHSGERYTDATIKEHDCFGAGRTQLYIINGNLNPQRYIDEILRPIVMPFLKRIGLRPILQDDNAWSHRGRIVIDFVQQNNIVRMD